MRKLRQMTSGVLAVTALTFGLVTTAPAPVDAQQTGLVNVTVERINVAVPIQALNNVNVGAAIALAANICGGAQVGVLAAQLQRIGTATCTATSDSRTGDFQAGDVVQITKVQQ